VGCCYCSSLSLLKEGRGCGLLAEGEEDRATVWRRKIQVGGGRETLVWFLWQGKRGKDGAGLGGVWLRG
jgi:hypothetical protein